MKTHKLFCTILLAFLLTSCASSFYQVYQASPSDKIALKDNMLVYEDGNCSVSYNLWGEGGDMGFIIFNKTDKNIYLNLEESFFVFNGMSYNYFRDRVFTSSIKTGASSSHGTTASVAVTGLNLLDLIQSKKISSTNNVDILTSSENSISYKEEKIVIIPSRTSKAITEYCINKSIYRDCALLKFPTEKQIKTLTFTKAESPIVFSNRLAYTVEQSDQLIKFENEFYVSNITNYPKNKITESKYDTYCDQVSTTKKLYFKNVSPDKFYIQYTKGIDELKH